MKNKKLIVLMWLFALIPPVLILALWSRLPARVPVNWGFNGQVTYGSKTSILTMAALSPLIALMLQVLPKVDPKKRNYAKFQSLYDGFTVVILAFLGLITCMVLLETFRPGTLNVGRVVMAGVSVLFLVIGCILGKVKPNWFMGIRTPWTLSDPDVWNKTHRMGGWVFFLSGAVTLVLSFLATERLCVTVMMLTMLGGMVLTVVMSFLWYKARQPGEE